MKERIFSAILLIFIAVPIIIAGGRIFAVAMSVLGLFALKEVIDLKKSHGVIPRFMQFLYYLSLFGIIFAMPFDSLHYGTIFVQFISFLILLFFLPTLFYSSKRYNTKDAFYFLGMILFLGFAFHSIIIFRMNNLWMFLYFLLIPIMTDNFSFLFGTLFGKHHIAPSISPNKTIEGSIFGTLFATIVCSGFYFYTVSSEYLLYVIAMTVLLSVISQMGDLFFSKIKRENGVKDFSNLIPGHGGILDRFDSIIVAAIAFSFIIYYL